MKRVCTKCEQEKEITEFPPDKRASDGCQARCRSCINTWMKEHARSNPAWQMWRRARSRAAKKGFDFNITVEDLLPLPTHCPIFGTELRLTTKLHDPHTYSLDRIRNDQGYVRGNVMVMSYRANRLKNDGTAEDHEAIAQWMRANAS